MSPNAKAAMDYTTLINDFNSIICSHCGGTKRVRTAFCRQCYLSLPVAMRNDLFKSIGAGYAEAKEAASVYLVLHKPIR